MASADLKEELNCSICLEIYTDPATLKCGHNFCQECINGVLDSQRTEGVFTCPECRTKFKKRPWLQKNVTLSNIAEQFRSTLVVQKKSGVFCTHCIHAAVPAIKCCLHCEALLCESHLKVHSKSPEHVLTVPTNFQNNWNCSIHNDVLQYYCTVDSTCICVSCLESRHNQHPVQPLDVASRNKKDKLKKIYTQLTSKKQETENRLQNLQETKKKADDAVAAFTSQVGDLFQKIRQRLDVLEVQTVDQITRQAEENSEPVSDLIQQLEVKKDELCNKICYVEELRSMTDPLMVLLEKESIKSDFCVIDQGSYQHNPKIEELNEVLISLNLHKEISNILASVPKVLNLEAVPDLRLDEETAATNVVISPDFLIVHGSQDNTSVEDTDDRFESYQVLSRKGLEEGRHYWEAEVCDTTNWRIGMSYFSIDRDGEGSIFGNTDESWCLCKSQKEYFFKHDGDQIYLPFIFQRFRRFGIYLDYDKGQLSFYNLEPEISHLHTFYHNFFEPLHAAIRVGNKAWVRILN